MLNVLPIDKLAFFTWRWLFLSIFPSVYTAFCNRELVNTFLTAWSHVKNRYDFNHFYLWGGAGDSGKFLIRSLPSQGIRFQACFFGSHLIWSSFRPVLECPHQTGCPLFRFFWWKFGHLRGTTAPRGVATPPEDARGNSSVVSLKGLGEFNWKLEEGLRFLCIASHTHFLCITHFIGEVFRLIFSQSSQSSFFICARVEEATPNGEILLAKHIPPPIWDCQRAKSLKKIFLGLRGGPYAGGPYRGVVVNCLN